MVTRSRPRGGRDAMPIHSIQMAALAVLLSAAPAAAQVTEQHFRGGRTADLAALCAASPREALGSEAIAWCHGFVVATAQYHASASAEGGAHRPRSEEHTSELQSRQYLVCRLLLEKNKRTDHQLKEVDQA